MVHSECGERRQGSRARREQARAKLCRKKSGGRRGSRGGAIIARFIDLCTPDAWLGSVLELTPGWLRASGIDAVVADLDNTLVPYGRVDVDPAVLRHVQALVSYGLRLVVLSNAGVSRIGPIASVLGIPYVANAGKPARGAYARALSLMGSSPQRTAAVGDQVFRDVLGARRAGLLSVLVTPLSARDFPGTALLRGPERLLIARQRRLGRWPEQGLPPRPLP
jgi:uncharacterized protein